MTPPRVDKASIQAKLRLLLELLEATVGLITAELAASMGAAAGMRNLLVYEYVRVDLALVAAAVPRARADVQQFVRQVSGWLVEHG